MPNKDHFTLIIKGIYNIYPKFLWNQRYFDKKLEFELHFIFSFKFSCGLSDKNTVFSEILPISV